MFERLVIFKKAPITVTTTYRFRAPRAAWSLNAVMTGLFANARIYSG